MESDLFEIRVVRGRDRPECVGTEAERAPLVRIVAGHKRVLPDFGELWVHRELLYLLALRDIQVRYKQTALGVGWAILQPFLTMVVFSVFFGTLARIPSDGIPYPLFAYAGLLPWVFFSNTVGDGSNSLIDSSPLITKVYFPRILIPSAVVIAGLLDFALASLMLIAMIAWYGTWPGWSALLLPMLLATTVCAALSVTIWLSALNVKYRDIRYAVPFVLQLWMFVTPVIYPTSLVPEGWRWILLLNPLGGLLEGYRAALLDRPFPWADFGIAAGITGGLLALAVLQFTKLEREFADVV